MKRSWENLKEWLIILGFLVGGGILSLIAMIFILAIVVCFACASMSPFIIIAYIISWGNNNEVNNFAILILGFIMGVCIKVKKREKK